MPFLGPIKANRRRTYIDIRPSPAEVRLYEVELADKEAIGTAETAVVAEKVVVALVLDVRVLRQQVGVGNVDDEAQARGANLAKEKAKKMAPMFGKRVRIGGSCELGVLRKGNEEEDGCSTSRIEMPREGVMVFQRKFLAFCYLGKNFIPHARGTLCVTGAASGR